MSMKVLVMSEEKKKQLTAGRDSKYWPTTLVGIDEMEAAMTEVEVPDGCRLAVVDTNKGIGFQEEADYVLLVQEVKL